MTSPDSIRTLYAQKLKAHVFPIAQSMGEAAASEVAEYLNTLGHRQDNIRVIFACAPSQNTFLKALTTSPIGDSVPWNKMTVFHMDDYLGMKAEDPHSFRSYLQEWLLSKVKVKDVHLIPAEQADSAESCAAYADLLNQAPIDLICLGIGENGHLAFNDPPVADFDDPEDVKVVVLDETCRNQQVNDGCFASLSKVPTHAITLTLPVFRKARRLSCVVPGSTKARAVLTTLYDPISTACPATLLRDHPDATIYLDSASARLLP